MRNAENIRAVEALGIDFMGFIFWPHSKRYIASRPDYLPVSCKRVGVFVNENLEQVRKTADEYAIDILQLHGNESPEYLRMLKTKTGIPRIIKAFNIATPADLAPTADYEGLADFFLFDTKGRSVGGNGEAFDWDILSNYHGTTPFLLSGGIGPDDANQIRAFRHEKFIGIDLNSRFETAPGLKNIDSLRGFINDLNL